MKVKECVGEPSGSTTRATEDVTITEESVQIAELATKDSIVAVAAEDDSHYDYYLLICGALTSKTKRAYIPSSTG